ncbi:DMT family transporter [Pseudemcibacter aquimaris]|uniref:aromatic amino acid exporter YddG n=1 Tax=Pseudemcibacter aquimaris TaxID=2857064 RepID=UPI0020132543|nr:EamA family transporter [Pseudemcibacter aquimaris]MCC3859665.1 EamA family transporter [Pseudemcibacter aquimaris]WDU60060.1 EamA family transporter [Pseudemcibacter aquimaris]
MQLKATLIGSIAIFLWSVLALFTSITGAIPAFQLLFLTFLIGGLVGLGFLIKKGVVLDDIKSHPMKVWLISIGGLFGYHFFYFTALGKAPVADASLIAYLWPLLIVLLSPLVLKDKLRWYHLGGAMLAFSGAAYLLISKGEFLFSSDFAVGYLMAFFSALIWSVYSILNRTINKVGTEMVAFFCLGTALLGGICHVILETWVSPDVYQWLAIAALGVGPVGAAFYAWDYGTKHGNIRLLGVFSYAAPLLSTIILTVTGHAVFTWGLMTSCLLIVGGALLASIDVFKLNIKKAPGRAP